MHQKALSNILTRQPIEYVKYLQVVYLIKALYLEYIKNSYNFATKIMTKPEYKWAALD